MQRTEIKTKEETITDQLVVIHHLEQNMGIKNNRNIKEEIKLYIQIKLLLRRFDFGLPVSYEKEVYEYIRKNKISDCMIVYLVTKNMFYKQRVVSKIIHMFEQAKEQKRADYYRRILTGIQKKEGMKNE